MDKPQWIHELQLLERFRVKAEIEVRLASAHTDLMGSPPQSLSSYGLSFLSDVFLREKLLHKDWI